MLNHPADLGIHLLPGSC